MNSCALLTAVCLTLPRLHALTARGCRTLAALDLDCPNLLELDLGQPSRALTRASLASAALTRLCWRGFPCLDALTLSCPNLTSLDLSQCSAVSGNLVAGINDTHASCPSLRCVLA